MEHQEALYLMRRVVKYLKADMLESTEPRTKERRQRKALVVDEAVELEAFINWRMKEDRR